MEVSDLFKSLLSARETTPVCLVYGSEYAEDEQYEVVTWEREPIVLQTQGHVVIVPRYLAERFEYDVDRLLELEGQLI